VIIRLQKCTEPEKSQDCKLGNKQRKCVTRSACTGFWTIRPVTSQLKLLELGILKYIPWQF